MNRKSWELMGLGIAIMFLGCVLVNSPWAFVLALGSAVFGGGVTLYKLSKALNR